MTDSSDSRNFVPTLTAGVRREGSGAIVLAPAPGLWREGPEAGALVRPGDTLGVIEILGVQHRVVAPDGAVGIVSDVDRGLARRPVGYGEALFAVDPEALGAGLVAESLAGETATAAADGSLIFPAPSSGRLYLRPAPDKPPFVREGETIERGQTVGLLEVMKTFTRVNYDDPKLPAKATIVAIVAEDQADLGSGDPILRVRGEQ